MSNWTPITIDDLKAAGYGTIVDAARTNAIGGTDPATEVIANAIARVRSAVSKANALDQDTTKVPNSLRGLTVNLAFYALCDRISFELTADQRDTKRNDQSFLNRIIDEGLRFETPDNPDASSEMQSQPTPRIEPRTRNFTERTMDGV